MTKKFELFFGRIKKAAGVTTDKELADLLGLNKSALSMWKKREKVDYDLLFTKFEHINYHWLLTGDESVSNDVDGAGVVSEREEPYGLMDNDKEIIEIQRKLIRMYESEIVSLQKELEKLRDQKKHYKPL